MGPIDNAHYRSYVADIHFSSTHLLNLINEILDVTKAEAGKLEVQEEVFDLRNVIEAVVRISGPPIDKAGVSVTIDLPADLPWLRGDEGKTRQVFFNLVSNAVKFTPAGGLIEISGRFDDQSGLSITARIDVVCHRPTIDLQRSPRRAISTASREFACTVSKSSGVASKARHIDCVRPTVCRVVEDLGAAHQRNVAGASAMNCAGFAARHRSGICFVVDA